MIVLTKLITAEKKKSWVGKVGGSGFWVPVAVGIRLTWRLTGLKVESVLGKKPFFEEV